MYRAQKGRVNSKKKSENTKFSRYISVNFFSFLMYIMRTIKRRAFPANPTRKTTV